MDQQADICGSRAWEYLLDSVKTGETPFEKAHEMPLTKWLERNPHVTEIFNEANAVKAAGSHRAIVDAYNFSNINTLTDIGGGIGTLMAEILAANAHLKGVVADLPSVVLGAEKTIRSKGLHGRCKIAGCDFFRVIPKGSESYLMSNILHDWPDDKCKSILNNCRKAMQPEAKLLLIEMIVPEGNDLSIAKLLDLEMLVVTGGKERTKAEFDFLLESSGLKLVRIIPAQENIFVIEAMRL